MAGLVNPNQLKLFMSGKELGQITTGVDQGRVSDDPVESKRLIRDMMQNKWIGGHMRRVGDQSLNENMAERGVEKPIVLVPHPESTPDNPSWQFGNGHHRGAFMRREGRLGRERYAPVVYDEVDYHGGEGPWRQTDRLQEHAWNANNDQPGPERPPYPSDQM